MNYSVLRVAAAPLCFAISQILASAAYGAEPLHDTVVDEIIVTTNLQQSRAESSVAVNILDGESLREAVAATLGETLKQLVGVNSASFGSGVGTPVIRGQSGNRVQVLQGGVSNIDASSVSPDHANSVEAALASRIEVLRGPSTLMYGNGAIGGVVNVITNRIPTMVPSALSGLVETRHRTSSDQQSSVVMLEGGVEQFAWHVDASYRENNDTQIDGFAINPKVVDIDDEEALEELLASKGRVANTSGRADAASVGGSWVFGGGYAGMNYSESTSQYGIPAGAHGHEEHEEGHGHEEHEEGAEGGDAEGITIIMEQQRLDFETLLPLGGWLQELQAKISVADYEHVEIEPNGEVGTRYRSDGVEGRITVTHDGLAGANGLTGLQFGQKSFSAVGEESYIPATDIESEALFTVQSIDLDAVIYEFGLRAEHQHLRQRVGACDRSDMTVSASASGLWRVREDTNILLSLANSQRAPSVEELYSNIDQYTCRPNAEPVEHGATGLLEIGLPAASKEHARNIELSLRRHLGRVRGEVNVFYNDINDYLYLEHTQTSIGGVEVAQMRQDNAVFRGLEAQLTMPLGRELDASTSLMLFGDYVRAEIEGGANVPRIPAMRVGFEIEHSHRDWLYKVRVVQVAGQDRVGMGEMRSEGYTLVDFAVDYHRPVTSGELTLFGKLSNVLDEQVRNHTSLLKDVAPEPGRGAEVGVRYSF
jgi:iron complex outermembrane receptor protein